MGYKPTFEEFKECAGRGNLVPVYKEILADLDTPVSAYMKIGGEPYSFLLESVEGGDKWARYCFLGCGPSIIIETKGSTVTIRNNGVEQKKKVEGAIPLFVLKEILSQYQPVDRSAGVKPITE
jgi:anthranilate synthase component 1